MDFQRYFSIDENAKLFVELAKDPQWWQTLRNDSDLYINIRKDNRINVYYRSASVMDLSHDGKEFIAKIHNHYLGVDKDAASTGNHYGLVKMNPEDIVAQITNIKGRIDNNSKFKSADSKGNPEGASEKYIQSEMYKKGNYIDTEFALSLDDGTEIRIDLVKMNESGQIQYVELKRIQDDRLTPQGNSEEEIITQMKSYAKFIEEIKKGKKGVEIVVEYYKSVLRIMDKIKIQPQKLPQKEVSGLSEYVELFITSYQKKTKKRDARLKQIGDICETHRLHTNIDEVITNYNNLKK